MLFFLSILEIIFAVKLKQFDLILPDRLPRRGLGFFLAALAFLGFFRRFLLLLLFLLIFLVLNFIV